MITRIRAIQVFVVLTLSMIPATGYANVQFEPSIQPTLEVPRISGGIKVDGQLDDPGWTEAVRVGNFTEYTPAEMVRPPVETEVMIAYDEANLYLAFVAHDDPKRIRASLRDRDEMYRDDFVGIMLDTFGNGAWYYELFANPLGVQGDLRWSDGFGEDGGFDIVWDSRGVITDDGYQVEMSVPFASLRFKPADEQVWRANFWRNHPRESRSQYSWAALSRDEECFPCQFGTLRGIRNVRPGNPLEILPSVIGYQSSSISDDGNPHLVHDDPDGEMSIGGKYAISTNLTAEATFNPDFSQVESDAGQIDVNTTYALFFPERRPFFQEGSDLFTGWVDAVYTRAINDPTFAGKTVGRMGNTSFGILTARDNNSSIIVPGEEGSSLIFPGKSWSTIGRVRQSVGKSQVGALFSDRRLDVGGNNTVFGADGIFRFLNNYRIEYQGLFSHTQRVADPEAEDLAAGVVEDDFIGDKWGHAVYASFERGARHWNLDFDYTETSPDFRSDNGFITRNRYRATEMWTGYAFRPNTKIFEIVEPSFSVGRIWNTSGAQKDEWIRPELWVQFKSQTWVSVARLWSSERFGGIWFDDIRVWDFNFGSEFSDFIHTSFGVSPVQVIARNLDPPEMGKGWVFNGSFRLRPSQRLILEPSWRYSQLDRLSNKREIFRAYILRNRLSYQFTRALFARFVVEYADSREDAPEDPSGFERYQSLSVEPLLTYRVNPFTTFFIGLTSGFDDLDEHAQGAIRPTSRQFFFKLQYLLKP